MKGEKRQSVKFKVKKSRKVQVRAVPAQIAKAQNK
jgi:hypothetical protein